MRWTLLAAVVVVACKGKQPEPSPEPTPAPKASASAKAKPTVVGKPIVGTNIEVVRCNVPLDAAEGENHVAATRHLHVGPDKSLYFFPDFKGPVRLEPTSDGCGYAYKEKLEAKKDSSFGLEPDGSFKEYPYSDDSPQTKCRVRAFSNLRYGMGRLVGGTYYYKDKDVLTKANLADPKCEPEQVVLKEVPAELGTRPDIGNVGDHLLLGYSRPEWKHHREVFRYTADGTFVRKYGSADEKGDIGADFVGCGEGLCAIKWQSNIVLYDREGIEVANKSLSDRVKLERTHLSQIVDVPGKGVYALIGYIPQKGGKGHAEVVRVDGVY